MFRLPLLAACALLLPAVAAAQPALHATVVVNGPVIRLGDLFSDAGAAANTPVADAPPLGGRVVYDAAWLAARAREQHLDWQPRSRFDEATVERASEAIPADAVAAELKRDLADRLPSGLTRLDLDNASLRLFVPVGTPPTIAVDDLTYDERSGRLSAYVSAPAGDPAADRVRVTGRVYRMIELPVLARPVMPGDVITQADIDTITVRSDRMTQAFVVAAADLVGKTPLRGIAPGQPVRPSDIQVPIVIHKGDLVTVVLQTPTMTLTARGKALDDGARGAAIRVSNTRSGRMLDAVVTGPGTVSIVTASVVAAR